MAQEQGRAEVDGFVSPKEIDAVLQDERTTEQIIEELARAAPQKHGVPLARRLEFAQAAAKQGQPDALDAELEQQIYESRVYEIGGDPDEMLPGNKPRYTMGENYEIKDHATGAVHAYELPNAGSSGEPVADVPASPRSQSEDVSARPRAAPERIGLSDQPLKNDEGQASALPNAGSDSHNGAKLAQSHALDPATCDHSWPSNDPNDDDRCVRCGITFEEWAMS